MRLASMYEIQRAGTKDTAYPMTEIMIHNMTCARVAVSGDTMTDVKNHAARMPIRIRQVSGENRI
jgi:hypothetical protein